MRRTFGWPSGRRREGSTEEPKAGGRAGAQPLTISLIEMATPQAAERRGSLGRGSLGRGSLGRGSLGRGSMGRGSLKEDRTSLGEEAPSASEVVGCAPSFGALGALGTVREESRLWCESMKLSESQKLSGRDPQTPSGRDPQTPSGRDPQTVSSMLPVARQSSLGLTPSPHYSNRDIVMGRDTSRFSASRSSSSGSLTSHLSRSEELTSAATAAATAVVAAEQAMDAADGAAAGSTIEVVVGRPGAPLAAVAAAVAAAPSSVTSLPGEQIRRGRSETLEVQAAVAPMRPLQAGASAEARGVRLTATVVSMQQL